MFFIQKYYHFLVHAYFFQNDLINEQMHHNLRKLKLNSKMFVCKIFTYIAVAQFGTNLTETDQVYINYFALKSK